MKTPKKLKTLKSKMLAIQNGNYDVEAENPRIVKCWERLDCKKTQCPAYGRLRCWSIAGTSCHGEVQGEFAQKIGDCRECVVYKESCGDEIGELIEVFNQMVKDIKYDFSQRERCDREKARSERLTELGDMVAAVAHEARNPLHSIGIAASYLKKNFHGELVTEFLSIIEDEVRKLNDLTSLFLSFSHPAPLSMGPCDLNAVVGSTVDLFRSEAEKSGIAVTIRLDNGLPRMTTDTSRIRELVSCLMDNALEAAGEGGVIAVTTANEEGFARISVSDSGAGIDEEEKKNIFRPFYTTKIHGPGLGLAIVERSVKELNGGIEVESAPGKGAIFSVLLPIAPP